MISNLYRMYWIREALGSQSKIKETYQIGEGVLYFKNVQLTRPYQINSETGSKIYDSPQGTKEGVALKIEYKKKLIKNDIKSLQS